MAWTIGITETGDLVRADFDSAAGSRQSVPQRVGAEIGEYHVTGSFRTQLEFAGPPEFVEIRGDRSGIFGPPGLEHMAQPTHFRPALGEFLCYAELFGQVTENLVIVARLAAWRLDLAHGDQKIIPATGADIVALQGNRRR